MGITPKPGFRHVRASASRLSLCSHTTSRDTTKPYPEVQGRGGSADQGARDLGIKNPHDVADGHGDPTTLRESLIAAQAETLRPHDQLKAILAEALTR